MYKPGGRVSYSSFGGSSECLDGLSSKPSSLSAVPPPKRSPPPTLAEIAAVLKDFLGAVAYGVHLSMSKKEKAPADPAEKAKDE